ncbi:MAG: TldD/PmbA family protein, partial [Nitrosopumilus sp.]|nr:TldD/PmbA family protein [Nitrosopumilus sp.]
ARDFWGGLPYDVTPKQLDGAFDEKLAKISGAEAMDIAQNMINSASNDKVNTITGSLNIVSENFEIRNSNGLNLNDKGTYISAIINAESEYGNLPVSGIGHASGRTLANFSAEQVGTDAKVMCIKSINPQKINSDTYSIIFEPYSVGELLAFVVASNFNFKTVSEKRSCFSNNIEKEIAVKELSLIDEPHIPEGIGTKSVDDEGVETQRRALIEKGIFKNTFSNLFDSYKEGVKSTGNGARLDSSLGRSSEPIPISAPHNLKMTPGDTSQEDMIKDTKHGLLVGRLWYTYAVNPIQGDFSCTARSGIRIIENGEIKGPGKSIRIVHNLPTMLKNISSIGNDQKNIIQWASLPSIAPSIKAENITVTSI